MCGCAPAATWRARHERLVLGHGVVERQPDPHPDCATLQPRGTEQGARRPPPDGGPEPGVGGLDDLYRAGLEASGGVDDRLNYHAAADACPDRKSTRLNSSHDQISYAV